MKIIKLTLLLLISSIITANAQFQIIKTDFTSFANESIPSYMIEGEYCVIYIDSTVINEDQLQDTLTLQKIVKRTDDFYEFYKTTLGYEPSGGNTMYDNKANVFFSYNGLGLVGAKGIEVPQFQMIFNKFKNDLHNINPDNIIAYEFGRNFFTYSSKILFPFTPNTYERNGGFAEGFANVLYTYAYDEILELPKERQLNNELWYITFAEEMFYGYISDTLATPYNFLAKWDWQQCITDPNRRIEEPAYTAFGILHGTIKTFGKEHLFPDIFTELSNTPDANSIEDALSNLALSVSRTLDANLLGYFENVLKFQLNESAIQEIQSLPVPTSKLIRIEDVLWFISPFDNIRLALRSTNYLKDSCVYQLSNGEEIIATSKNGNFDIEYSVLGNMDEINVTCKLLNEDMELLDSYNILLKKRHNFNPIMFPESLSFYYQYASVSSAYIEDNQVVIENNTNTMDGNLVSYNLIVPRDRTIEYGGSILHNQRIGDEESSNSEIVLRNRVYVVGTPKVFGGSWSDDPLEYVTVKHSTQSNFYFIAGSQKYESVDLTLGQAGNGKPIAYFKDVFVRDITDTDGDGFIDFEDNCPSEYGTENGCPAITDVDLISNNNFNIYPNPTRDQLYVETDIVGNVQIYNLQGMLMLNKKVDAPKNRIDISELSEGSYLFKLETQEGNHTKLFIKH